MEKSFNETLKEQFRNKGCSVEKLSGLTSIPDRYLTALLEGDFKKLPAVPYVRGYLIKIAAILDLNPQELWESYKNDQGIKSSGAEDKLPANRFAIKQVNKKMALGAIAGVLVGAYLIWNVGHLIGRPKLEIGYPLAQTVIVAEPFMKLTGNIDPADKFFINEQETVVGSEGAFEMDYNLEPGLNTLELKVKRFLGRETKAVRQIIYQPQ
jgi:lambda repressor-like predicted transcriptional regulator